MPAPLPSATTAPENSTLSMLTSVFVTRIALPLGMGVVDSKCANPPTPSMVTLVFTSAKSLTYVPACTCMVSPSCDAERAADRVANSCPGPTVRILLPGAGPEDGVGLAEPTQPV